MLFCCFMWFYILSFLLTSSLGDIFNPSDNIETVQDSASFNFTVTVPADSSGNSFRVESLLTFDDGAGGRSDRVYTEDVFIIVPTIEVQTIVSQT